jgi:cytochrome P450 family 142 subfamily A polypeptide 1
MTSTLAVDLMSGAFYADDPHEAFSWMRRNQPVYHDETNDIWGIASYQDVRALGTDPALYSNAGGIRPKFPATPMMIDTDPPQHTQRRKLVSAGFTPRRIAAMTEHVRRVCDEVLDAVCEQGACDFVRDIAAPLPLAMIGDMLGVAPDDRADLLRWSDDMLRSQGDPDPSGLMAAATAFAEYTEYMRPVMEQRRATGATDDLVGILVNAELDGERLDEQALIFETLLILVGGDETTRHVLSGGMLALQERPEQLAALAADPSRLPRAVEEMLRWVSPIQDMVRTTTREVRIGDVLLPEGAELMLLYPSANRDESVFDEPFRFDIDRNPNPHIAFGMGEHFCLGNQLARLELNVMFERLLTRLPDLHLAGPGPFPKRPSNFVCGLEQLPVEFTPTRPVRG